MDKIEKKIVDWKVAPHKEYPTFDTSLIGKICWVGDTKEELDKEVAARYIRTVDTTGYRVEGEGSIWDNKSWLFAKERNIDVEVRAIIDTPDDTILANASEEEVTRVRTLLDNAIKSVSEDESKFVELLDQTVTEESIKPLNPDLFERIETLKVKASLSVAMVRPRRLDNTWRLKPPHAEHSLRVTLVANITPEGKKVPYEILLNTKNPETFMHLQAHALVISSYFREAYKTGISLNSLIQTLKDVFDPKYPSYRVKLRESDEKPTLVHSIVAEIGYVIEEFYEECLAWNYSNSSHENPPSKEEKEVVKAIFDTTTESSLLEQGQTTYNPNSCPKCDSQLTKQSGCDLCLDCGYSKCS